MSFWGRSWSLIVSIKPNWLLNGPSVLNEASCFSNRDPDFDRNQSVGRFFFEAGLFFCDTKRFFDVKPCIFVTPSLFFDAKSFVCDAKPVLFDGKPFVFDSKLLFVDAKPFCC